MPGIRPGANHSSLNRTGLSLPEQADPGELVGMWAVAGTLVDEPYPCKCSPDGHWNRPVSAWCDCVGRTDLDDVPAQCCARRAFAGAPVTPRERKWATSSPDYRRTVTDGAP